MSVDKSGKPTSISRRGDDGPKPVRFSVRAISALVILGLVFQSVAVPSQAAPTPAPITISASTAQPIFLQSSAEAPPAESDYDGTLTLTGGTVAIDRDYSQRTSVTVANTGSDPVTFYLECDNSYSDLSLNFVNGGSLGQPLVLQPGESQQVDMLVFAQNADYSSYTLPVYAHVVDSGLDYVDSKTTVTLTVDQSALNLAFKLIASDPTTLAQTYTVTNNGAYVSDLTLSLTGDARDYVQIDPGVSTFPMSTGDTLTVTLRPDLGKMANSHQSSVSGSLVASSGQRTSSVDVVFQGDTRSFNQVPAGQLVLHQDGNPYWNLDWDQQSVHQGTTEVDDNGFSSSTSFDLTYGQDQIMPVQVETSATPFAGDPATATVSPTISTDAAGNTVITATQVVSQSTYDSMRAAYDNPSLDQYQATADASWQSIPVSTPDGTMFAVSELVTFAGNVGGDFGELMNGLGGLLSAYQFYEWAQGSRNWTQVADSPNLSSAEAELYIASQVLEGMLLVAGIAIGFGAVTIPGSAALSVGVGLGLAGLLLDIFQSEVESEAAGQGGPESLISQLFNFLTRQCTNRHKVDTAFQLPAGNSPGQVTTSSRIYPDNPLPIPNVDFSTSVNGQDTGITQVAQLTDVVTTDLSPDYFNPGEVNTITRNFTIDGAHFLTTADTQVHVAYSSDTPVWYAGSIDTAPDLRSLPDLAVYPEGIQTTGTARLQEPNQLSVDVYNRGSIGAWAEIVVSDDAGAIYTDSAASAGKYRYIAAFSSAQITVPVTLTSDQTTFTVDVTDKTVGGQESNTDNNHVTTVIRTKPWAVPSVDDIAPRDIAPNSATIFTADVSDTADVVGARFLLDGAPVSGTVATSVLSSGDVRYSVPSAPLTMGAHTLVVEVDYTAASGQVETVSDSIDVNVTQPRVTTFSVDSTITNPHVTVLKNPSSSGRAASDPDLTPTAVDVTQPRVKTFSVDSAITNPAVTVPSLPSSGLWMASDADLTQTASNQYSLVESTDMTNNPDTYAIVVAGDNGYTWATLAQGRTSYSLDGQPTLTVHGTDLVSPTMLTISSMDAASMGAFSFPSPSVSVPAGTYSLMISYTGGTANGTVSALADLTGGDASIDLAQYVDLVSVQLPDETGSGPIDARLILGSAAQASSLASSLGQEPSCAWSASGPTGITCVLTGMGLVDKTTLDQGSLLLNLGQAVYQVDLSKPIPTSLRRSDLAAVSFIMPDGSPPQIGSLVLSNQDLGSFQMTGSTVYCPPAAFDVTVSYALPGAVLIHRATVEGQANTTITLPTPSDGMAVLSVDWPTGYTAEVGLPGIDSTDMAMVDNPSVTLRSGEPQLPAPSDALGALLAGLPGVDGQANATTTLPTSSDALAALLGDLPTGFTSGMGLPGTDVTGLGVADQPSVTLTPGEPLILDPGDYDLQFSLHTDDGQALTVASHVSLTPGANTLVIGDHYTGTVTNLSSTVRDNVNVGGSPGYVTIANMVDDHGNSLENLWSLTNPMTGTATFTNTSDPSDVVKVPLTTPYTVVGFTWPNVTGVYNMNVVLGLNGAASPSASASSTASAPESPSPSETPASTSSSGTTASSGWTAPSDATTSSGSTASSGTSSNASASASSSGTSPGSSSSGTSSGSSDSSSSPSSDVSVSSSSPSRLSPSSAPSSGLSPSSGTSSGLSSSSGTSVEPSVPVSAASGSSPSSSGLSPSSAPSLSPTTTSAAPVNPSSSASDDPGTIVLPTPPAPSPTSQPPVVSAPTGGSSSSDPWLPLAGWTLLLGLALLAVAVWIGSRPNLAFTRRQSKEETRLMS